MASEALWGLSWLPPYSSHSSHSELFLASPAYLTALCLCISLPWTGQPSWCLILLALLSSFKTQDLLEGFSQTPQTSASFNSPWIPYYWSTFPNLSVIYFLVFLTRLGALEGRGGVQFISVSSEHATRLGPGRFQWASKWGGGTKELSSNVLWDLPGTLRVPGQRTKNHCLQEAQFPTPALLIH